MQVQHFINDEDFGNFFGVVDGHNKMHRNKFNFELIDLISDLWGKNGLTLYVSFVKDCRRIESIMSVFVWEMTYFKDSHIV